MTTAIKGPESRRRAGAPRARAHEGHRRGPVELTGPLLALLREQDRAWEDAGLAGSAAKALRDAQMLDVLRLIGRTR